jgi:EmrB/QacA subfamily drug resistance transporter
MFFLPIARSENVALTDRNRSIIQTIVIIGIFMSVLDSVVVNIALPEITNHFNVDVAFSQWVITTYPLVETALLIVFGKIAERTGKASMFTAGLGVFTVASLLCGLSSSLEELIVFRIIQGVGASMLFSISIAITFEVSRAENRGKVMGMVGGVVAVASMVGPPMGGFIVGYLGWQYIFFVNVPIGLVATVAALHFMKLSDKKAEKRRFDIVGAALWTMAVSALLLMIGQVAETGDFDLLAVIWTTVLISSFVAFIIWERRAPDPLLDLSVFKVSTFTLACSSAALFFITVTMVNFLSPFYFEGVMGYSAQQVGMILMIIPTVLLFGSPYVGKLVDRTNWPHYQTVGMMIRGVSLVALAYAFYWSDIYIAAVSLVFIGVSGSLFQPPNNLQAMTTLTREKTGTASSVLATARNLGISLGSAFGAMLLVLQLGTTSITGSVDTDALATATAVALVVAAIISFIGAITSYIGSVDGHRH